MSLLATFLFIYGFGSLPNQIWLSWGVPIALVLLMVVNFLHFTRGVSWILVGGGIVALLCIGATAFMAGEFKDIHFIRSVLMYGAIIYVGWAQKNIFGRPIEISSEFNPEETK